MAPSKGITDRIQLKSKPILCTKKDRGRSLLLGILCFALFLLIVVAVVYVALSVGRRETAFCGVLDYDSVERKIYISESGNSSNQIGELGKNLVEKPVQRQPFENGFEYSWQNGLKLVVKALEDNCTSVKWSRMEAMDGDYPLDCYVMSNMRWYGGAELYKQVWPFDKAVVEMAPYYPQDIIEAYYQNVPAFGPVVGRYWINSLGFAYIVNQSSPLVVGINTQKYYGQLCLTIDPSLYPSTSVPPELDYTICKDDNVKLVHQAMVKKFFKKLTKGPDEKMIRHPVWSTWVKYHKEVDQSDVEEFLGKIVANNFSCSQIEIDDKYTTTYGDYDFDPVKFPKPKDMIERIHNASCRVTTWVHPFADVYSKAYAEGKNLSYFVVGSDGKTPGLLKWWNGWAAAVDVTKPSAYKWFLNRLKGFQTSYRIDSFKFDGGSVSYLPFMYRLNGSDIPSNYSVQYAKLASEVNNMVEVRVADHSQDLSVFVRFLDRDASWDSPMGLQSVIPTVLTLGILGYPFILPDMIGGNGMPEKELFIRWMQLNTFLPSMQFSIAPWDFDTETIEIAHNLLKIRDMIMPTIIEGVDNAVKTGEPIIRPLWWIAPQDPVAFHLDQQFMVTDVYLVAPVVTQNAANLTVYLPKGIWLEEFGKKANHTMTAGGYLVYNNITLEDVFYFKNITLSHDFM